MSNKYPALTKQINMRLSPDDHAILFANAKEAGLSASDYIRYRCIANPHDDTPVIDTIALKKMLFELMKQGVNLNQLMRFLNAMGSNAYDRTHTMNVLDLNYDLQIEIRELLDTIVIEMRRHGIIVRDQPLDSDDQDT